MSTTFRNIPDPRYNRSLPIIEHRSRIVSAIQSEQVLIVAGETGSGKTTQLPQLCLEAGRGMHGRIGVTQPRRIAATSIARRVAEELGTTLGDFVGYRIRFDEKTSANTGILFMTDGILLNEIHDDRLLKRYDTLIIDEAHERSLNIDFLIGYLRKILYRRPDLKLIVSSATIETSLFSQAFDDARIIEVSGRLFPVDIWYQPPVEEDEDSYVSRAVDAVGSLIELDEPGDILVFMPTERDIRECIESLRQRCPRETQLLPLFGRLPRSLQDRIFASSRHRKVVVATNIAETSLTVPGIRFVVDTGLARLSRYSPHQRITRLPIEPISQASANQRAGRCGRVADGVCVRLYGEDSYKDRAKYTDPEISRTNLAGVVLHMAALQLGRVEQFPFLQPPSRQAIREAYGSLRELGAVDSEDHITGLGKKIARFPLDPHVARMLLEARRQRCAREVAIIAAALSIVDPRERPPEQEGLADAAHRDFLHPRSDFLFYVTLWDRFHEEWETMKTQGRMRRFCKQHFLSFSRLREWIDVHEQITRILKEHHALQRRQPRADYDAIHRSLLSGLASQVGQLTEEGTYRSSRGRSFLLFPGSVLFRRKPDWVVCHQIVQTSRVFGRTCAVIKPEWIEELFPDLIRRQHSEPFFDEESGSVRARERVLLFGLAIIEARLVRYGPINPDEATDIFVREGLVEARLQTRHRFFRKNQKLREKVTAMEDRLRRRGYACDEEEVFAFYRRRLTAVSSGHDLNRIIRERKGDGFLLMRQEDLLREKLPETLEEFPEQLQIGNHSFPLRYAFTPGGEEDGVTVELPESAAMHFDKSTFGWIPRPYWPDKVQSYLRQLTKAERRHFSPMAGHSRDIARSMRYGPGSFAGAMCRAIEKHYGMRIDPDRFSDESLPAHLRMRLEIHAEDGTVLDAGRDFGLLRGEKGNAPCLDIPPGLRSAFCRYERTGLRGWDLECIPETIEADTPEGAQPLFGYPALVDRGACADLVVCLSREDADEKHAGGVSRLLECCLQTELGWLERDLRPSHTLKMLTIPFGGYDAVKSRIMQIMKRHFLCAPVTLPRNRQTFECLLASRRSALKEAGMEAQRILTQLFTLHEKCQSDVDKCRDRLKSKAYGGIGDELLEALGEYMHTLLRGWTCWPMVREYPRYLEAFAVRIQRAYADPMKFRNRLGEAEPFFEARRMLVDEYESSSRERRESIIEFVAMIEEFLISLFAQQEIKARFPISAKRLRKKLQEMGVGS